MVRNYKCPGCGATMEYDPIDEKLHCSYCNSAYAPEEINQRLSLVEEPRASRGELDEERSQATIRMNIAVCNSCGGELAMNHVEVSSFCPYCGNAAVVMDRVEERLAPDYIIPFKVSRDQAEIIIRRRISTGFYVPAEIKNFELEKLRGIYIPFWLYDVYYGADQKWRYSTSNGKNSTTYFAHMTADVTYHHLTVDASKGFVDASSQRLEPFYMSDLRKFDASYLSGFYADRFDVGAVAANGVAIERAGEMFNDAVKDEIGHKNAKLVESYPKMKVLKKDYAFLPVWFLTFRHDNMPYTILLNGQTKKMVGAVPVDKKKAIGTFLLLAAILCPVLGFLGGYLLEILIGYGEYKRHSSSNNDGSGRALAFWIVGTVLIWVGAIRRYISMKKSIELSRSRSNNRLAKERQDKV